MNRKPRTRSTIVPGRKMITEIVALREAGLDDTRPSYLEEPTVIVDESMMNDSANLEEREWRKQGLSEKQMFAILEKRKQTQLNNARKRLEKEMYGAKTFKELIACREYSECESDSENTVNQNVRSASVFAIPALPKHISEKSMMGSPIANSRGSGKAGLSCSTPKSSSDTSMRSLRSLDISHVVNTDRLDAERVTVHTKSVVIPTILEERESTLQKTLTIEKNHSSQLQKTFTVAEDAPEELQKTVTIEKNQSSEMQRTFTVAKDASKEQSQLQRTVTIEKNQSSQLQGNFTVAKDAPEELQKTVTIEKNQSSEMQGTVTVAKDAEHSSLQKTFTKPTEKDESSLQRTFNVANRDENNDSTLQKTFIIEERDAYEQGTTSVGVKPPVLAQNTMEGGEKRRTSKVTSDERERRNASISNPLHNSMLEKEEIQSPGANFFKHPRKKIRPVVQTPPRIKATSRLSTESNKERTIEMESVAEERTMEADSIGSSYISPTFNASRVSPVPEVPEKVEPMHVSKAATPKSIRHTDNSIRNIGPTNNVECARAALLSTPTRMDIVDSVNRVTPARRYEQPTFASLVKRMNMKDANRLLEETSRKNTPAKTTATTSSAAVRMVLEDDEEDQATEVIEKRSENGGVIVDGEDEAADSSNRSLNIELNALTVNEEPAHDISAIDFPEDDTNEMRSSSDEEEMEARPDPRKKSSRRLGLLSDSIALGLASSSRRRPNDTFVDETWYPEPNSKGNRRPRTHRGMKLKEHQLMKPEDAPDGVRRSTRVRVKPVRSWLGEQPVYVNSPISGCKRLTGVTAVVIKDPRLCYYRTADVRTATERELKDKANKRALAQEKKQQRQNARSGRRHDSDDDEEDDM
ncbi:HoloCentric chromosome binding Protein [Caenorhabditis elegans]|uniref:CENP-C-like protein HCP-4 n=1 Tax=Caenorhabditis elegans TaxID=6239 RepID=G5EDA3_CAEEL|nr:HoloCentric chromosome binding Protein [Caenorhabditis elegans]AAK07638.1 CENP-C-like protein HCP-4 [Caenorhabditis elegans]CCD67794.1 HoloCentric chromosome binding Protein [Caenorhabditis elegans]|eukprot:NP_491244.1 HoloCentric chromosome binding Protein [Caenorhabditis elegans]